MADEEKYIEDCGSFPQLRDPNNKLSIYKIKKNDGFRCVLFFLEFLMNKLISTLPILLSITRASAFWDAASTTNAGINEDTRPRQSFFRWMWVIADSYQYYYPNWDWNDLYHRRQLHSVCGISIDFLPINTGALLNQRTVVTSANALAPWMNRQKDLRIWALGHTNQPMPMNWLGQRVYQDVFLEAWRYRVWRVRRMFPLSMNPEHWHGARGVHQPRHDVVVINTMDKIFMQQGYYPPNNNFFPFRAYLARKDLPLRSRFRMAGTGYMTLRHVRENYRIVYNTMKKEDIVDCSIYLPKWWGKFICFKNIWNVSAVPNGGPLYTGDDFGYGASGYKLVGLGCFEIRYNEDRIMVFTDLRYYMDMIEVFANITPLEYYEYAYPEWGWVYLSWWDAGISGLNPMFVPGPVLKTPSLYPETQYLLPLGRK